MDGVILWDVSLARLQGKHAPPLPLARARGPADGDPMKDLLSVLPSLLGLRLLPI